MARRMVFKEIREGDVVQLTRPCVGRNVGRRAVVSMKCRDGLTGRPMVRLNFGDGQGEPFVTFPTGDLAYAEESAQ